MEKQNCHTIYICVQMTVESEMKWKIKSVRHSANFTHFKCTFKDIWIQIVVAWIYTCILISQNVAFDKCSLFKSLEEVPRGLVCGIVMKITFHSNAIMQSFIIRYRINFLRSLIFGTATQRQRFSFVRSQLFGSSMWLTILAYSSGHWFCIDQCDLEWMIEKIVLIFWWNSKLIKRQYHQLVLSIYAQTLTSKLSS